MAVNKAWKSSYRNFLSTCLIQTALIPVCTKYIYIYIHKHLIIRKFHVLMPWQSEANNNKKVVSDDKKLFVVLLQSWSWLLHCSSDSKRQLRLHGCLKTHICTANKREIAWERWCRLQGEEGGGIYRFNFQSYWKEDGSRSLPVCPSVILVMCFTELLSVLWQDRAGITDRDGVGSSQQKKAREMRWKWMMRSKCLI